MKRATCFFVVILYCMLVAKAGQVQLNVIEHTLKNGMRIFMVERHDSPTVATHLRFHVGGVDDPKGQSGVAHLLEHMMFKGTKTFGTLNYEAEVPLMSKLDGLYQALSEALEKERSPFKPAQTGRVAELKAEIDRVTAEQKKYVVKNELWQAYQRAGGVGLNASTAQDSTQYFVQLPSNQLAMWAYLESDRIANPVFREFYSERDVVHEERRLRTDTQPVGQLIEAFHGAAYMMHPYRNPVVGWPSDIDATVHSEVLQYFKAYYAPNNAIAVLVGDIDPQKVIAIMEKYFGPIPAQPQRRRTTTDELPQKGERRLAMELDAQPRLSIGYHIPGIGQEDTYALTVLARVLSGPAGFGFGFQPEQRGRRLGGFGGANTGRFFKSLILGQQLAVQANASAGIQQYPGLFVISAAPAPGRKLEDLEQAIYQELDKLKKEPVTDDELQRVKKAIDAGAVRQLTSNSGIASAIASAVGLTGDWRYILTQRERLKAVTAADVARVADKYFSVENRTVAVLKTKGEGRRAKSEERRAKSEERRAKSEE